MLNYIIYKSNLKNRGLPMVNKQDNTNVLLKTALLNKLAKIQLNKNEIPYQVQVIKKRRKKTIYIKIHVHVKYIL